jgi:hypothetical protein
MRLTPESMRTLLAIVIPFSLIGAGGCVLNNWHEETYFDEHAYPSADAASAVEDENRIIGFIPSLGFKRDDHPTAGTPATEAVFIRSDNDHFHITITVRALARIDQPGFITVVHVDSYNIGEEGAIQAGKSTLNEIDQLYRKSTIIISP